jgi:3-isopropylmalate/(R)-2-methylmalate dehydratase small subunit
MRLEARAIVIPQDDVDTDVLYPGQYLNVTDVETMTRHLFEGLDPALRDRLGGDTALVVGANFGSGSSREHVPQAMRASGIRFLVGKSFARIFARNCLNLGLPIFTCPAAVDAARDDATVAVDLDSGKLEVDGAEFSVPPLPPFMRELVGAGGLVDWVRGRLDATTEVV